MQIMGTMRILSPLCPVQYGDTNLSVTSFMGIIMMAGIVVSNGILLVD